MSDVMLIGVLRMPDELFWNTEPLARMQHNSRRLQAADELEERADKIEVLEEINKNQAKIIGDLFDSHKSVMQGDYSEK